MSSCNCMLLGREIATYRGTKCSACMMIMQNDTYFTRKLNSVAGERRLGFSS